jgi:hypothetical protein
MPPSRTRSWSVFGCTYCLVSMLLLVSASSAFASASVRFVHAVPGAGAATLNVSVAGAERSSSAVAFGKASAPIDIDAGDAKLTVVPSGGGDALASAEQKLEDGRSYTAVAMPANGGDKAQLQIYEDSKPQPGQALLRAINAGPELGEPDVRVGERVIAEKLAYAKATDYVEVPPGTHDVSVTRAGGSGGALATQPGVPLTAGTATTAIVLGSSGEMTRILTLSDGTAAPPGAPATGFGGIADDDGAPAGWLVALLAALGAAGIGAAGWTLSGRR